MASCAAVGCGNYVAKHKPGITFHRFPSDPALLQKWMKAIRRPNWRPSKYSRLCSAHFVDGDINRNLKTVCLKRNAVPSIFKRYPPYCHTVCELHFKKNEIETESSAYDPKTGRTLTAPLGVKRLKKGVIPSLLIPTLNADNSMPNRENPEEKRMRKEKEQLNLALQQSLKSVPGETSQSQDASGSDSNSSLPISRQSVDTMVENQHKKATKRKKRYENEVISKKKINVHDSDSVEKNGFADIQEVSQNNDMTYSKDSSSNSIIKRDARLEQQTESLSHSQISSRLNSVDTEISESSKNHQVQVKEEKPWEEEYGLKDKTSELEENDMVKIVSVESSSINGTAESSQMGKGTFPECYDSSFYKKPLKIDNRDEAFGKLVACEMSDLRGNPELYLKTQQSILKLLVEAHFEQMSTV